MFRAFAEVSQSNPARKKLVEIISRLTDIMRMETFGGPDERRPCYSGRRLPVITYFKRRNMKRRTFAVLLFAIAWSVLSLTATAQAKPKTQQPVQLGPKDGAGLAPADLTRIKAGDAAPDFTLEEQDGKPVSLSDYRGKKTVVLVFYRGYW